MADDKKKVEKPFVDTYTLMKYDDLMKHFEKHYANTPEDADRREGYDHEKQGYLDMFESVQNSYLKTKRGESAKTKGTPKRYALSKKDVDIESSELVNKVLLAMVEEDNTDEKGVVNKAVVDLYKKDPHRLQHYARGYGIDYDEIKKDLIDNYRNIKKAKKFNQIKEGIASLLIKDQQKVNRVQSILENKTEYHTKIRSYINGRIKNKIGHTIDDTVNMRGTLGHFATFIQGGENLPVDYIQQNDMDFKKMDEKKEGKEIQMTPQKDQYQKAA